MSEAVLDSGAEEAPGKKGLVDDWSRDKQVFGVPWGKAMMWIFLLSDTFIFSCFLVGYMSVRIATTDPVAESVGSFCAAGVRRSRAAAPDRDHDVHPDHVIRNDGAGGEHGLPQGSQQDLLADGRDGAAWAPHSSACRPLSGRS